MPIRKIRDYPNPGFGLAIREARQALGLNQREFGESIGTNKVVISHWECEKNFPSDANLAKIRDALGIEVPFPDRYERGRRAQRRVLCEGCGKEFPQFYGERYCSLPCAHAGVAQKMLGRNLQSGRFADRSGYIFVRVGPGNYVREHRLVMEQVLGRTLEAHEKVHHKNGVRHDNRPENLELWRNKSGGHPVGVRAADYHCAGCRCFDN